MHLLIQLNTYHYPSCIHIVSPIARRTGAHLQLLLIKYHYTSHINSVLPIAGWTDSYRKL